MMEQLTTLLNNRHQLFLTDNREKTVKENLLDMVELAKKEIEALDWQADRDYCGILVKVYAEPCGRR